MKLVALFIFTLLHLSMPLSGYAAEMNCCAESPQAHASAEKKSSCCPSAETSTSKANKKDCQHQCPNKGACCPSKNASPLTIDVAEDLPSQTFLYSSQRHEVAAVLDSHDQELQMLR